MMKIKKITAVIFAASFVISFPAQANMQNALNSMFAANVTIPGAYQSATRSGFVGGGITLRTPIKPINLFAFDPPRISAGCGGLDMYGGSFSFINSAQFTALLRNIMNNAAGLLFQAALKAIDPGIADLLNAFSKMIQDMNALASNTCAIANQAINSIKAGSLETELTQAATTVQTSMGTVGKAFDSLHWPSITQAKSDNKAVESQNPSAGNFTWKALNRKNIADTIGDVSMLVDPGDPKGNKSKLFMLSLIGTEINSSFVPDNVPSKPVYFGPKFDLLALIAADSVESYDCSGEVVSGDADVWGPNSCVDLGGPVTMLEFAGSLNYVRNMLYGDSTQTTSVGIRTAVAANSPQSPGPNSIYGKLFNCTTSGCALSAKESAFLGLAGPIFKFIKEAQYDHYQVALLSQYIEQPLSIMIVEKIGEATVRAAKTAWNGIDVKMPASVADNIKSLDAQLLHLRNMSEEYKDNLHKADIIAETVRKNFPALGIQ